jgi:hypothetical protein
MYCHAKRIRGRRISTTNVLCIFSKCIGTEKKIYRRKYVKLVSRNQIGIKEYTGCTATEARDTLTDNTVQYVLVDNSAYTLVHITGEHVVAGIKQPSG